MIIKSPIQRIVFTTVLVLTVLINTAAYLSAWRLTHFHSVHERVPFGEDVFGSQKPRHQHQLPDLDFIEVDTLQGGRFIESWKLDMEPSKGVFLFFHDYLIEEDELISRAIETYRKGYTAVIIFFRGYGRSEGDETTFGYLEAEEVEMAMEWCTYQYPGQKIYLVGKGMSSLSIFRAVSEFDLQPVNIIIEDPQYSVLEGVQQQITEQKWINNRLVTFWIGTIYGFNLDAFKKFRADGAPWIDLTTWRQKEDVQWIDVVDSAANANESGLMY